MRSIHPQRAYPRLPSSSRPTSSTPATNGSSPVLARWVPRTIVLTTRSGDGLGERIAAGRLPQGVDDGGLHRSGLGRGLAHDRQNESKRLCLRITSSEAGTG